MNNSLSTIVLTHNDENRIVDCIESILFANEIIIIDDNSSDRTLELAKQYTKNIYKKDLQANFASQRNFALNYAHNTWVLFVDSDEIVSDQLKEEILKKIQSGTCNGYFLKRIDVMWGEQILYGEAGGVKLLRLAKKGYGKWHGKVHETWKINGNSEEMASPLLHIPHQSITEFVKEVDLYSTIRAVELFEKGARSSIFTIFAYPFAKFLMNYLYKRGYRDKLPGFIYAIMMSLHSFLVRAKLFLLTHEIEKNNS